MEAGRDLSVDVPLGRWPWPVHHGPVSHCDHRMALQYYVGLVSNNPEKFVVVGADLGIIKSMGFFTEEELRRRLKETGSFEAYIETTIKHARATPVK